MLIVKKFNEKSEVIFSNRKIIIDDELKILAKLTWENEKLKRKKNLFNGKILSAKEYNSDVIIVTEVEYKFYLAKKNNPTKFKQFKIIPVSVSGLLQCLDGIVFGKRSKYVTQYPGFWELVPSGGLDYSLIKSSKKIDYKAQVLNELSEELGVQTQMVKKIKPFCFIFDTESQVLDIGVKISCNYSFESILRFYNKLNFKEYDDLCVVKKGDIPAFIKQNDHQLVNVSKYLLKKEFGNKLNS